MGLVYNLCFVVDLLGAVCIPSLTVQGGFFVFLISYSFLVPVVVYVIWLDTLAVKTCFVLLFVKLDDRHSLTSKIECACIAGFSHVPTAEEQLNPATSLQAPKGKRCPLSI